MELARQLMDVQSDQHASHRPGFGITSARPLSIGNYSIVSVPKAKNMEAELQLITLKRFKARFDFDYREMNSQIKRAYTHVHRIEDIWIDMRTELDIMKMDYCRLTLQQIIDLNMLEIPPDFQVEDDGNILDPEFHQAGFDRMCPFPIQWQQKEGTSILDRFQSILANTNKWLKSKGLKRVNPKMGLDCGSFGPPGRKSQLEIAGKDGASSSNIKNTLKFKLKGGKGTKSSQVPEPIQESVTESEEELETKSEKEDSDEEGEIRIISPPKPARACTSSPHEEPFLHEVDDDVDSFSTVFTHSIPVSEVNTMALPISSAAPRVPAHDQFEHLANVFEDFPTLTSGQVSQLDTSLTGFEIFMTESSQHVPMPTAVQTESFSVTTDIQSGSMPMVSTVPASTDESFSLPAWLSRITTKRRKVIVPPDDLPVKKTKSKSLKDKIVSRILVDSDKTKYVEVAEPLVDKPVEELTSSDYKFTKVEVGKQSRLSSLQDAHDALANVSKSSHELWEKKNQLKQEIARLNEVIQKQSSQNVVVTSQTSKERRLIEAAKSWIQEIIAEGVQAITETLALLRRVKEMNRMELNLIASLTQEADDLKEILEDWDEMIKFDLDAMVSCDVLPSCEMFFRCQGRIGYKEETLRKLITKLQVALEDCQAVETSLTCDLEQLGCRVIDNLGNLLATERVNSEYTIRINADVDSEEFGSHTMNKFVLYKSLTKHLLDNTTTNSKVIQSAYENAVRIEAISKTMEIADLPTVRDVIVKFKALRNNL